MKKKLTGSLGMVATGLRTNTDCLVMGYNVWHYNEGLLSVRPGMALKTDAASNIYGNAKSSIYYDSVNDKIWNTSWGTNGYLGYSSTGAGAFTQLSTSYKVRSMLTLGKRLWALSDAGMLEVSTSSAALSGIPAGLPPRLTLLSGYTTAQSVCPNATCVSYRVVYQKRAVYDNKIVLSGAPSGIATVLNNSGSVADVQLDIPLPSTLVAGDQIEVYRSRQPSANLQTQPTDDMVQVALLYLDSTDISRKVKYFVDRTQANSGATALYTNASQNGAVGGYYPCEAALTSGYGRLAAFDNCLWASNYKATGARTIYLTRVGGDTSSDQYAVDRGVDAMQKTGTWTTTGGSKTVTGLTAAEGRRLSVGMYVKSSGASSGIPANTQIKAIGAALTSFDMGDANGADVTATGASSTITVGDRITIAGTTYNAIPYANLAGTVIGYISATGTANSAVITSASVTATWPAVGSLVYGPGVVPGSTVSSVSAGVSFTINNALDGDAVSTAGSLGTYYFKAATTEFFVNQISTNPGPVRVRETALDLVQCINAQQGAIWADYVSGANSIPGAIRLKAYTDRSDTYTVYGNCLGHSIAWSPALLQTTPSGAPASTYPLKISSDVQTNVLVYSAQGLYHGFPPLNKIELPSQCNITGLASLRSALLVFTDNGLFRITGSYGAYSRDTIDPNLKCSGGAVIVDGYAYAHTNQGLIKCSEGGYTVISQAMDPYMAGTSYDTDICAWPSLGLVMMTPIDTDSWTTGSSTVVFCSRRGTFFLWDSSCVSSTEKAGILYYRGYHREKSGMDTVRARSPNHSSGSIYDTAVTAGFTYSSTVSGVFGTVSGIDPLIVDPDTTRGGDVILNATGKTMHTLSHDTYSQPVPTVYHNPSYNTSELPGTTGYYYSVPWYIGYAPQQTGSDGETIQILRTQLDFEANKNLKNTYDGSEASSSARAVYPRLKLDITATNQTAVGTTVEPGTYTLFTVSSDTGGGGYVDYGQNTRCGTFSLIFFGACALTDLSLRDVCVEYTPSSQSMRSRRQ